MNTIIGIIKFIVIFNLCGEILTLTSYNEWTLNIVHTNDMHSRFDETSPRTSPRCRDQDVRENNCYGGFARLATLIKKAKSSSTPTLFLNAGDTYQGSAWFAKDKWKVVAHFLELLKPDAICLGNHEFDTLPKGLVPFVKNVSFPVLASNLNLKDEPELDDAGIKNSVILDVGHHKVGIVGFVTPETKTSSIGTGNVIFLDEIESVRREVKILKQKGVNIIIGLGHSGYEREKRIARAVDDLDLIIGGHTNTFLYNGPQPDLEAIEGPYPTVVTQRSGRKVYVVQAGGHTKYLGNLSIVFDGRGEIKSIDGNPILLDRSVEKDEEMLKELDKWRPEFNTSELGQTKVFLDGDTKVCRSSECILGNLITDAMVDYNANVNNYIDKWTDAAIAILSGGTIRSSIESLSGEMILYGDIKQVIPFANEVKKLNITGAQLFDVLENSVRNLKYNDTSSLSGGFLQVSGIKVTYNLKKKAGSKVIRNSVLVRCADCLIPHYEKVDMNKIYTVLGPNFLLTGGDKYDMLKNITKSSLNIDIADVVAGYIKSKSPLQTEIDGRINFKVNDPLIDDVNNLINESRNYLDNMQKHRQNKNYRNVRSMKSRRPKFDHFGRWNGAKS
ncbi:snake venom 5'-nucleotidase-like [Microplitis mediator]|uniref:snake venom 5'-nucleotidase-like n=1 Tax=Microplitis mediator TaxID=375433 RepID=UPI0025533491|nr:snake venom 5'-nucleotidase-like [Microplitis mediator]